MVKPVHTTRMLGRPALVITASIACLIAKDLDLSAFECTAIVSYFLVVMHIDNLPTEFMSYCKLFIASDSCFTVHTVTIC